MQSPSLLATTKVFPLFYGNQSKAPGKRPAAHALQLCRLIKHFSHSHCWVGCALENCQLWKATFQVVECIQTISATVILLSKGETAKVKPFESASRFQQVFATRVVHKQVQILRLSSCGSKRPRTSNNLREKGEGTCKTQKLAAVQNTWNLLVHN